MTRADLPIVTPRLILRPFAPTDLAALKAIYEPPESSRYLYSEPFDEESALKGLARRLDVPEFDGDKQTLNLAAELKATGEVVGDLLFFYGSHVHRQGEIGYVYRPDAQGQGLATEALREVMKLGYEAAGAHRIVARCDARNAASIRVMTALGMRPEAHFRENEFVKGEWTDEIVYALLASEWRDSARRA
ncbi:MAG: GNAT family N-acetyltransferase [Acidimicrobiales bacterium]